MTPALTLNIILLGSGGFGGSKGVWDGLFTQSGTTLKRNARTPFKCFFYEMILKVPLTKSAAGQQGDFARCRLGPRMATPRELLIHP